MNLAVVVVRHTPSSCFLTGATSCQSFISTRAKPARKSEAPPPTHELPISTPPLWSIPGFQSWLTPVAAVAAADAAARLERGLEKVKLDD